VHVPDAVRDANAAATNVCKAHNANMNGGLQNDGGSVGDRPGRNDTEKGTVEPLVDKRVESAAGSTTGAEGCGKEVPGSSDSLIDSSNAPEEDPEPASGPDRAEKKADEPPEDWLEPLEDDYDDIDDTNDTKRESERSGSVAGSERNYARRGGRGRCRRGRKSQMADEEWEEWPVLGKGWKRKEVLRRSGNSVGQSDTYYMSPSGARVRSRIELVKYLAGSLDLGTFDFKTGIFTTQLWQRRKRSKLPGNVQFCLLSGRKQVPPLAGKVHLFAFFSLLVCVSEILNSFFFFTMFTLSSTCTKCGQVFTATNLEDNTWIPCGQCKACLITEDCKSCASCRNSQISQKPVRCRKRKCLCPIQYRYISCSPQRNSLSQCSDSEDVQGGIMKRKRRSCGKCEGCNMMRDCGTCDFCIDKPKFGGSNKKRQKCRLRQCQRQAMRHLLPFQSEILTQEGRIRPRHIFTYGRKRIAGRSQFRSQEKLDFEFSDAENEESVRTKGAARQPGELHSPARYVSPNNFCSYTAIQNVMFLKLFIIFQNRIFTFNFQSVTSRISSVFPIYSPCSPQICFSLPQITQIYSLADDEETMKGIDLDHDLLRLLESLRTAMLPVLWFALMARGPRLQLLQCSKLSTMADTVVHIEPSYTYQITVQGQPLIPTHPLYVDHPTHLASVAEVVTLLQDLEKYSVCQGLKSQATHHLNEPLVHERAATCDFLVPRSKERCAKCCNPTEK
uniref:Methyl-CpG binding domain protein 1b n=1 Tax=Denticeps clupeoides TaxID=299321 RepID=A0AAY4BMF4_9TELE